MKNLRFKLLSEILSDSDLIRNPIDMAATRQRMVNEKLWRFIWSEPDACARFRSLYEKIANLWRALRSHIQNALCRFSEYYISLRVVIAFSICYRSRLKTL